MARRAAGVDSGGGEAGARTPRARRVAAARGAARVDSGGGGGAGRAAGVGASGSCPWCRGGGGRASRDGLHGEAAGRQGAAGRHGAADSSHRGEPEPAVPHGARPAGWAGGAGRPRAARGFRARAGQGLPGGDRGQGLAAQARRAVAWRRFWVRGPGAQVNSEVCWGLGWEIGAPWAKLDEGLGGAAPSCRCWITGPTLDWRSKGVTRDPLPLLPAASLLLGAAEFLWLQLGI